MLSTRDMIPPVMSELYSIYAVANYILYSSAQRGQSVSNLRMQKLAYFSQGFALAASRLNRPLFAEDIQAWTYGPVIPVLYRKLKRFANGPITGCLEAPDIIHPSTPEANIIDEVIDKLGHLTASQLVFLSHKEDSPWAETWNNTKYAPISHILMKAYFSYQLTPKPPPTT